jgi:hypothetical protein
MRLYKCNAICYHNDDDWLGREVDIAEYATLSDLELFIKRYSDSIIEVILYTGRDWEVTSITVRCVTRQNETIAISLKHHDYLTRHDVAREMFGVDIFRKYLFKRLKKNEREITCPFGG